jgi:hypothetical protein
VVVENLAAEIQVAEWPDHLIANTVRLIQPTGSNILIHGFTAFGRRSKWSSRWRSAITGNWLAVFVCVASSVIWLPARHGAPAIYAA